MAATAGIFDFLSLKGLTADAANPDLVAVGHTHEFDLAVDDVDDPCN